MQISVDPKGIISVDSPKTSTPFRFLIPLVMLGLVITGGAGAIYFQNALSQSQELRGQAQVKETPRAFDNCMIAGCNSEVCVEKGTRNPGGFTTCVYRPEYACLEKTVCRRQADGKCGWSQTADMLACIAEVRSTPKPSASPSTQRTCETDADCGSNVKCIQPPMPPCPPGMFCAQVLPPKVCETPTNNNVCDTDADCGPNARCVGSPCPPGVKCFIGTPRCVPTTPTPSPSASPTATPTATATPSASVTPSPSDLPSETVFATADLNQDGHVTIVDLTLFIDRLRLKQTATLDVNHDGQVNLIDYASIVRALE